MRMPAYKATYESSPYENLANQSRRYGGGKGSRYGLNRKYKQDAHAEETIPVATQAETCTSQVKTEIGFTSGNLRLRRRMSGVATTHGSQENTTAAKRISQAWCMPSERMTKTVSNASISPKLNQIDAIQIHRGKPARMSSVPIRE